MVLALVLTYLEKIGEGFMSGIGGLLVAPIQEQFKYLCCFNSHITELETKLRDLEATRQVVQNGADEIRRQARDVRPDIEDWLKSVNDVTTEVKRIIQDTEKVEDGCLNGWCSNLKLRYSLSMQAVTKTKVLIDLRDDGVRYTQTLPSYRSPRPGLETISNRDFMRFVSRRLNMEEIIKALKHDAINLIGVCGMGGVGKTTLVKEVAKIAKEDHHFDEVAMAIVSQKPNLTDVQACIAEMLGLKNLHDTKSSIVRADRLRRRLLHDNKKVLVILDDVWAKFDLMAMGIPLDGSNKNFKVLYTSRTRDLWHDLQTKKEIPLKVLSKDEAWQLFREKAGNSADAPNLQPIAKQIVEECGCLPLALVLIGSALSKTSGKIYTEDIWKGMVDRLTCVGSTPADNDLSSRLALSYEYLEEEQAKRLFLVCCLFRDDEDIRIEDLARYGLGLSLFDGIHKMEKVRRQVFRIVDELKSRYLLLDSEKEKEECVKVHDVVRDMGISIASKDKSALVIHEEVSEWPKDTYEHYSSISFISRKITELPKGLACPNLEFLLVDCRELKELPCQFFEGMGKLKVLVLKNFKGILALPSSLGNLHTLSLSDFDGKLENVNEFGGLFNLNTLSFRASQMEELPEEVRKLVNLRLLDLMDTEVERIPPGVISRLVHLEELYLNEFKDWEGEGKEEEGINANLQELESLSNLNALEIYIRSDVIPKFSICSKLKLYYVVIELEEMDDISDEEIEDEMDDISEEIEDEMDEISEEIEDEMDEISEEIEDEMDEISDEEIDLEAMEDIDLNDEEIGDEEYDFKKKCKRVLEVRSSIPIPSNREGIDLLLRNSDCLVLEGKGCNYLVQTLLLRDGVDGLQQLKFLRIERCDTPEYLANTMNPVHLAPPIFPILKELHLLRLVNLREICGGPVPARSFGELTFIRIQKCRRLRNLFQLPIGECLPQLKRLAIFSCGKMEEVFRKEQQEEVHAASNRIEFPKLEVLQLGKLPSLMGFCRGIDQIDFPQLKELYLKDIPHVNLLFHNNSKLSSNSKRNDNVSFLSFFPEKVSLPNLEFLRVDELENLERLGHGPLSVGSLSKLKYFSVYSCGKLLYVFPSQLLSMLRELRYLNVIGCDSLEVVFELEELDSNEPNPEILSPLYISLSYLPELNCISKRDLVGFKYIRTLEIDNCDSLRYVFAPTMTKGIPQLRKLDIRTCEMLSRIVAEENGLGESSVDEVEFPQLERLELLDLPNLVTFFPNVNTTSMAKSTDHLHNPMQSQPLFNEKVAFPSVKYLGLSGLQNVSDLWGSELPTSSFSKLETLNVRGFTNLRSTFYPSMVGGLANLSELVITDCSKMEEVVYWEEEIEDGQGRKVEKTMFPLLRKLQLSNLPNLVTFFPNMNVNTTALAKSTDHYHNPLQPQPLLNDKVAFPSLEYLELSGLESVSDLWCSELPTSSFSKLKTLNVRGFPNLRSTFHLSMVEGLANLSELVITDCSKMEGVVYWEEEIEDGQGRKIEKTMFPLLRKLQLSNLPNLVSFFPNVNVNTTTLAKSTDHYHNPMQPQPLFNEKVAFPSLEYLELSGLESVSDLWCSELPISSFSKLKTLNVRGFLNLRSTFHLSMVGGLANLSELVITDCLMMEGVVYWEEEIDDGQGRKVEKTMFPLLRKLQLNNLPNLVSFFPNVNTTLAKSFDHYHNPMQPQPLFNEKVAFPCLKYLGLSGLRNVSELPTSSISELKNLQVTNSTSLRNFPCILWIDDLMNNNTTQGLQEVARLLYTTSRSGDDGVIALGSNGAMRLWNWPSGKATASAFPHQWQPDSGLAMTNDVTGVNLDEAVPCVALSKDDCYYIISACGGAISLMSLFYAMTLAVRKTFMPPPPASTFLAFHPQDDDIIAIGMEDSTIRIYNHRKNKVIKSEMKGHTKHITGLAFSTNLNILVSSGADAQLCIWRMDTWEHSKSVSIQLPAGKACDTDTRVEFHSDRIRLLVSHETQLAIYDASEMVLIRQWVPQDVLPAQISFAVYSCDSQLVYTSFCDGNIGVFDADRLTLACHIVPSIYLFPAMLSGSQTVYPKVVAAHPQKPNQFAIGLTNGFVALMEPQESEGKWGLSPSTVDNGMLNDRTASSSNTNNLTPDQCVDEDVDEDVDEEEDEDADVDGDEDEDEDEDEEDQEKL